VTTIPHGGVAAGPFEALLGAIVRCELVPRTPLDAGRLAGEFGASRAEVLEALSRLAEMGLVTVVPRRSTEVSATTLVRIRDSVAVLGALVDGIVDDTVTRLDDATVDEMRRHVVEDLDGDDAAMRRSIRSSFAATRVVRPLVASSRNATALEVYDSVHPYLARVRHQFCDRFDIARARSAERELVSALADRDPRRVHEAWGQREAEAIEHAVDGVLSAQPELRTAVPGDEPTPRDRAGAAIRTAIFDGILVPGEPVPEATLLRLLGMPRAPVRGATAQLAADGVVERSDDGTVCVGAVSDDVGKATLTVLASLRDLAVRRALDERPDELFALVAQRALEASAATHPLVHLDVVADLLDEIDQLGSNAVEQQIADRLGLRARFFAAAHPEVLHRWDLTGLSEAAASRSPRRLRLEVRLLHLQVVPD